MTRPSGFFQTLENFCAVFPIIGKILSLCMIAAATALANPSKYFVGWAVGMTDGSTPNILCTTNGRHWFQQGAGQVPAINLSGVAAAETKIWVVGEADGGYASIYHSGDDGATWTQQVSGGIRGLQTVTMQKRANTYPAGTRFVWTNSPSPTPPYTNWHTAAQTLQAAVDIAETGDTVLAHDGSYESGGRLWRRAVSGRGNR